MTRVGPAPVLNAANALTVARILLVPVFVLFVVASGMTHAGWEYAAAAAFAVASATDYADGWIARSRDLVTSFGKVADPIADKALTGAALVLLSVYDQVPWWVTGLILVREWGVTALRFWVIRHGVIPASRGGKLKTALQVLAIVWYLLPLTGALAAVGPWLMAAALLVTVVTGGDYVLRALRVRRAARAGQAAAGPPVAGSPVAGSPVAGSPVAGPPVAGGPADDPALHTERAEADVLTAPVPAPAVAPPADEPVA